MRQSHLILSNASIMWITRVFQLVPQLLLVPYLISTIGETGYGVYALVWSLMISIDTLEISLQSGVVKYSAGFLAQGRMDEVNRVMSSSSVYSILLALLGCVGILTAAAFYKDPSGDVGFAMFVVGVMVLFIVPLTPYIAIIRSRQRFYVGAIADTIAKYVSLIVVVAWFHIVGPSVKALIVIMAAMLFLTRLAQIPIAYRLVPELQNRLQFFSGAIFRLIVYFGAATVLASLCIAANATGIRWLMDSLASTTFVAHLAIMTMPGLLLSQIISATTVTVMPATSAYEATGNQQMLRELLVRGTRYTTILALAGLLAAALLMRNVLTVWVGPQYAFLTPFALVLFASGSFMLTTSIAHHMLKGMEKLREVVFIYFLGLVIVPIVLILSVFKIWHDPYVAVTVGLAAGNIVCGYLNVTVCAAVVHADLRAVFMRAYAQPLVIAAATGLLFFSISAISHLDGLVGRISMASLATLSFLSVCYLTIATTDEQQQAKGGVRHIKRRITLLYH